MPQRRALVLSATPTLDTNAYAAGDALHAAAMEFDLAGMRDARDVILQNVVVADKAKQSAAIDLVFFSADIADQTANSAFDPTDTELLTIIGVVPISAYSAFSDNAVAYANNLALAMAPVFSAADGKVYVAAVSRGTPTYANGDLKFVLSFLALD